MAVAEKGVMLNGSASKSNRPPTRPADRARKSSKGVSAWLLSTITRLAIWYVLITCIFRCPSNLDHLDEISPQICKPYLTTVSYLKPHLAPYYDIYAAPFVERARPYAQQLDQKFIAPASRIAKHEYQTHAAPRLERATLLGQEQWENKILPQVQAAQKKAQEIYGASVAPHIERATAAVEPYYGLAREKALHIHQLYVIPAFETTNPYVQDAHRISQAFLFNTGIPHAKWAWSSMVIFVDGTLWPQLRALYRDNVRPQLVMISERIAKYQENRKLRASMEKVESSISADSKATTESTAAATPEIIPETPAPPEEPAPAKKSLTGQEQIAAARGQIASDLHTWQDKFAKAADKGSEDLQDRVSQIIKGLINSEVDGEGRGLMIALKKTVEKEMTSFKSTIVKTVSSLSDESDEEAAEQKTQQVLRDCANSIRDGASAIRRWHAQFEANIARRAEAAADSTLAVLDGIRDLGLQEIGMRWAWMDGVTYKDWAKYHELKQQFDDWRDEVRDVATKHVDLDTARKAGNAILEDAMDAASDAAMELVRLKDVAKWKIQARDSTDNFESRAMHTDAASAASPVVHDVEDIAESIVAMDTHSIGQATNAVSSPVDGMGQDVADPSKGGVESTAPKPTEHAQEDFSDATRSAASAASDVSSGLRVESSLAADGIISAGVKVKETIDPSSVEKTVSSASSVASSAPHKVFAGAMAQEISASSPILDDIIDDRDDPAFSEQVQSVVNHAGDRYADVTKAVSEALLGRSQGGTQSMSSVASEQYSNALAAASSVLYGTSQDSAGSITSVVSQKYSQAVSAASAAVYGTRTPASQSVALQANAVYDEAVRQARSQYDQARSILSAQISGAPKPIHEEMLSSVESAYSGSLATASGKLDSALSAVSQQYASVANAAGSFVSQPTQGPLESISSVASSNLQAALSMASAQYSSAKHVGEASAAAHQQYLLEAQQRYYAAMGVANERYFDFVSEASAAVYGTPTPVPSGLSGAASRAMSRTPTPVIGSVSEAASSVVYGTSDPAYQSAMKAASSQYDSASSTAVSNLEILLSSAKAALGATTESPVQSVFDQASSQYNMALLMASSSLSAAAYAASTAAYGTSAGAVESAASQASQNWESLVSKASEQVYGAPTPFFASLTSQAGGYSSQATDVAAAQYANVQAFVSELVVGREPDYTESVMDRLSSAYYTGYHASLASSASSLAGEAYQSASSAASSVSSVASSAVSPYFTPRPQIESILGVASDQLNAAVDAASAQIYGTTKGAYEQATSAASDAYSSISSAAHKNIYGAQTGYMESVKVSMSDAMSSAEEAISKAIYGTPRGTIESAGGIATDAYSSISTAVVESAAAAGSAASDAYSSIAAQISGAILGPEQSALESAQSRLSAAIESAQARIADLASSAGNNAADAADAAKSNAENLASTVSDTANSVTGRLKDEL